MMKLTPTWGFDLRLLILAGFILLLPLFGCSIFGEPVAEKVADAIDRYCEEPQGQRLVYRDYIQAELDGEGHSVVVTCQGDVVP